jgi:dolichol-phosphate mannosyltransferase
VQISIVAPAYNEEAAIEPFVRGVAEVLKQSFKTWEIIIVNDGSKDRTAEFLRRLEREYSRLVVVTHLSNRGLGAGLETGFRNAKGEIIVTMDADGTHDPRLIPRLYSEIENGTDVAVASRYVDGGGMIGVPCWRRLISTAGNRIIGAISGWPVKDGTSGYRAYRSNLVKNLCTLRRGFEVQGDILIRLAKEATFAEIGRAHV